MGRITFFPWLGPLEFSLPAIGSPFPDEPREGIHITHVISGETSAFGRVVCLAGLWNL